MSNTISNTQEKLNILKKIKSKNKCGSINKVINYKFFKIN